jgi:hypothetical protein
VRTHFLAWRLVLVGLMIAVFSGIFFGAQALGASVENDQDSTAFSVRQETPEPAPPADSDVVWTVEEMAFESLYPEGFRFTAKITSSAGPVVRGNVAWFHAPRRQRSQLIEIDPETGELSVTWKSSGNRRVPPWVGVTYTWSVGDAEGNVFQTEPQHVEYADNTRDWQRFESDDIIIFLQDIPEEAAELVIEAMAAQRETYRAAWSDLLPYKPRAILFGDYRAWYEWQGAELGAGVIGVTSDDWGGTAQVLSVGGPRHLAYGTVLHEVAHLYQHSFTVMPAGSWLSEGNATFFEIDRQYDYEGRVRAMAAQGDLPVLLQGSGPGTSGPDGRLGYDVGFTFFVWLTENYGLDAHRQFIELLGQGVTRVRAVEAVTGLSAEEVESRWRVWLGASPVVPTLVPTPTFFFLPSATPFGQ